MARFHTIRGKWIVIVAVALSFGAPAVSFAAYEGFLKIDGIDGESADANHVDWIDIQSYSHGIYTTGTVGGGTGTQATTHREFVILKEIDKATPNLNLACCEGRAIPFVTLQLHSTTVPKPMFMEIRLENAQIMAVRPSGSAADAALPMEEVKFTYSRIRWTYNRIDAAGTIVETIITGWNVETNTPFTAPSSANPAVLKLK